MKNGFPKPRLVWAADWQQPALSTESPNAAGQVNKLRELNREAEESTALPQINARALPRVPDRLIACGDLLDAQLGLHVDGEASDFGRRIRRIEVLVWGRPCL